MDRRDFSKLFLGFAAAYALPQPVVALGALSNNTGNDEDALQRFVRHRILKQQRAYAAVTGTLKSSERRIITVRAPEAKDDYQLDGDTIFEVASLTKIFTALLLAVEVVHKRVRLDDPLQDYVPSGVKAPTFEGRQITLADLATHGASLPLRPNNLAASAPDAPNKYAGYSLEQLYGGLPNYHLQACPGSQFNYSNLAFGLLGQGIALKEGRSFAEILRERVTGPLGLRDTSLEDDPRKSARRAQGHDFYLSPIGPTSDGVLAPAGGLRSTANDLLTLLDLFISGRGPKDLVAASRLMLSIDRPGGSDITRMALGWRKTTTHGETYYWSNGSSDGSRTFMGFNPARKAGVVALADAASGEGLDDIGHHFLNPQQSVSTKVIPTPDFITLPEKVLLRGIGRYEQAKDDIIEISRGYTGLIVSAGYGEFVIRPQSPTTYASKMVPGLTIEFEGADMGPALTLTLRQDDKTYIYKRIP
ncbi:serine hydrolase [Microbulbifer sp. THAF38]|uniref:serine hydrolase domain-containing protein n=1 Tax=Microbulbifer sp. THAF38 TaxID=2587856 RepID=UPI001268D42A|nr:serine hydrolase [Microbulbifer sp. THAF38]QFT54854.1 D-alanyl-D-alanine-carboxypeptidase/endopeptidase AmpH precursor [Microbulbifer sp. THAF38]